MSDPEISFRPSSPGDASEVVPLIYSSGPSSFDYIFFHPKRGTALDFLHYAYVRAGGEFGYTNHVCMEYGGVVAGTGAEWTGGSSFNYMINAVRKIIGFYGLWYGIGVMIRGLRTEYVIRPPKSGEHVVAHIGIKPEFQGKGLGTVLTDHFLGIARSEGSPKAVLDVSVLNTRAKLLYDKLGFRVIALRKSGLKRKLNGTEVADHHRMELLLH